MFGSNSYSEEIRTVGRLSYETLTALVSFCSKFGVSKWDGKFWQPLTWMFSVVIVMTDMNGEWLSVAYFKHPSPHMKGPISSVGMSACLLCVSCEIQLSSALRVLMWFTVCSRVPWCLQATVPSQLQLIHLSCVWRLFGSRDRMLPCCHPLNPNSNISL
jgi:hypothetical protein